MEACNSGWVMRYNQSLFAFFAYYMNGYPRMMVIN